MKRLFRKFILLAVASILIGKSYSQEMKVAQPTSEPSTTPEPIVVIVEENFSTKEEEVVETFTAGEAIVLPETPQEVPTPTPQPQKQVLTVEFYTEPVKTPAPTPIPTPESTPELPYKPPHDSEPAPEVVPTIVPDAEETAPTIPQNPQPTVQPEPEPEPTPVPTPVPTSEPVFDIGYWISFAQNYAQSIGLVLDGSTVDCWDNPIPAGPKCLYIERDITDRLNRYKNLEGFTDVWIWSEQLTDGTYSIYIGYA
ncbi:MAG: hypothetical protein IKU18_03545 [Bacteroidales bacterium]|nr:hypothetical protein [Bacteroidales bacterium]